MTISAWDDRPESPPTADEIAAGDADIDDEARCEACGEALPDHDWFISPTSDRLLCWRCWLSEPERRTA